MWLGRKIFRILTMFFIYTPVDNFGTVVGENPTPYGSLALVGCQWTVNCLLGP